MNRVHRGIRSLVPALLLSILAVGCYDEPVGVDDDGEQVLGDTGTSITILLTDAPADFIGAAEVDIGRVELIPADESEAPVVLTEDGTDGFVNLLDFQGDATTSIAEADIEPGTFAQLRLIVEAARVELIEGFQFRDGSTEKALFVPSGAQTGIKLNLHNAEDDGPLEIVPGETVLVLDFDVSQSFVLLGNPETPAGVHGVIFTPAIRVTGMDVAASISGTLTTEEEGLSVDGLTVVAEPVDGGDVPGHQTETGTALTAEDGTYTIFFLVPGTYDVTVDLPTGLTSDPESQTVELDFKENATDVDFAILDVTGSIAGTVSTALADVTVEGLTVTATPDAEGAEPITTETGSDGTYLFESVVPGTYTVMVEAGEDLVTDPSAQSVEVGNDEDVTGVDFEIIEDVTGSISGTVSTALEDVSVEGLTVTATPDGEGDALTATTASDGTYTIDSVDPGDYTVTVEVDEGLTTDPASIDLTIDPDEEEGDVNFEVISSG